MGAEGIDVDKALTAKGKGRDLWADPGTNVGVEGTSLDGAPVLVSSEMRLEMARAAEQKSYGNLIKARIDQRRAAEEASRARTEAALDAADEDPSPVSLTPVSMAGAVDSFSGRMFTSMTKAALDAAGKNPSPTPLTTASMSGTVDHWAGLYASL